MHQPRKHLGQHFLCDQAIIWRIVDALAPKVGEHLVEIGPGQGAITVPVLKIVKKLEAIELDKSLLADLQTRCDRVGQLKVYSEDVLEFDFAQLVKNNRLLRVFGNLPYNISTPLIFHLLSFAPYISDMLFMLQKEVAQRIAAKENSAAYGRLSVMVQYYCGVELLFDVPNDAFYPPPQVQSSMIRLFPYSKYPHVASDVNQFAQVVKQAFGQRRKTLRKSLQTLVSDDVWTRIGISPQLRAENLSVKDFVTISNALSEQR